jgi:hypothetical protein
MQDWYLVSGVTVSGAPRVYKLQADSSAEALDLAVRNGMDPSVLVLSSTSIERLGPHAVSLKQMLRFAKVMVPGAQPVPAEAAAEPPVATDLQLT